MSRPVEVLFRRVSPRLSAAAAGLVAEAATRGEDASSSEDVLRLAVDIGITVLTRCAHGDLASGEVVRTVVDARRQDQKRR